MIIMAILNNFKMIIFMIIKEIIIPTEINKISSNNIKIKMTNFSTKDNKKEICLKMNKKFSTKINFKSMLNLSTKIKEHSNKVKNTQ